MNRAFCGSVMLVLASLVLTGTPATAQKGKPPAQTSAKWDFTVADATDRVIDKGVFVAKGFTLHHNNKRIGMFTPVSDTQINMDVNHGKLNGKLDLKRDDAKSLMWKGSLSRPGGETYKVTIMFERQTR